MIPGEPERITTTPPDVKQVIVVRRDLRMRKGKIAAQAAHASVGTLLSMMKTTSTPNGNVSLSMTVAGDSSIFSWFRTGMKKIVVYCDSKEDLERIAAAAESAGILFCRVIDSGLTEFHGQPTLTCVSIGPAASETVDRITGDLKII